jgi:hypothetical protein
MDVDAIVWLCFCICGVVRPRGGFGQRVSSSRAGETTMSGRETSEG